MTKTWSRSPQHMPSLDLQIWSVTSARNGFGELWNTHTGRNQGNEAQMQVEHNSALPFSKFRYYGRLLRLLKRRRLWQGRKSKTAGWECEICTCHSRFHPTSLGGFETSTCSPCPETFAQQHFAVSLSKRGGGSAFEQIPPKTPFLEAPTHRGLHLCIRSPTNGNRRFPRSRQQEGHEG